MVNNHEQASSVSTTREKSPVASIHCFAVRQKLAGSFSNKVSHFECFSPAARDATCYVHTKEVEAGREIVGVVRETPESRLSISSVPAYPIPTANLLGMEGGVALQPSCPPLERLQNGRSSING